MRFSLSLPLIALLLGGRLPALAAACSARHRAGRAGRKAFPACWDAAIWSRLVTAFGPARAEPDNSAAQQAFIAAFPAERRPLPLCWVLSGKSRALRLKASC